MSALSCRGPLAWLLFLAPVLVGGEASPLPTVEEARRDGVALLPRLLSHVEAADPDVRLRARRMVSRIAVAFYRSKAPEGMRFVPGRVIVTRASVRCEDGCYLSVHEVTWGEFRPFAAARRMKCAGHSPGDDALPVTGVSLEEARAFARSKGARVPTATELVRAGQGGGAYKYPWGDRFQNARVNSRESGRGVPEPVGTRAAGRSVHGIHDLLGNVAEWTETSTGKGAGTLFAVVGGSYRGYARGGVRRTYRLAESARLPDVGFRLAKSLPAIPVGDRATGS